MPVPTLSEEVCEHAVIDGSQGVTDGVEALIMGKPPFSNDVARFVDGLLFHESDGADGRLREDESSGAREDELPTLGDFRL